MNNLESNLYHHVSVDDKGHRVVKDSALWALRGRIADTKKALESAYPWFKELGQARADAIIITYFEKGEIKESIATALEAGDYPEAAKIIGKDNKLPDYLSCQMGSARHCSSGCNC